MNTRHWIVFIINGVDRKLCSQSRLKCRFPWCGLRRTRSFIHRTSATMFLFCIDNYVTLTSPFAVLRFDFCLDSGARWARAVGSGHHPTGKNANLLLHVSSSNVILITYFHWFIGSSFQRRFSRTTNNMCRNVNYLIRLCVIYSTHAILSFSLSKILLRNAICLHRWKTLSDRYRTENVRMRSRSTHIYSQFGFPFRHVIFSFDEWRVLMLGNEWWANSIESIWTLSEAAFHRSAIAIDLYAIEFTISPFRKRQADVNASLLCGNPFPYRSNHLNIHIQPSIKPVLCFVIWIRCTHVPNATRTP